MSESEIVSLLDRLESEYHIRILYACESGSRAWGFASPDSDFDIRFVFARSRETYVSVKDHFDTIERPLEGLLDAGGWDIRKSLHLLGKSNGALVEWLHSPIVYREAPGFKDRWRKIACEVFSPKASSDHYRGLAKQMIRGKLQTETVRAKDYLYALRALLAAPWVTEGKGPPPVPFAELLSHAPPEILALIPALLEYKARSGEGERMERISKIDQFLDHRLEELELRSSSLARPVEHFDKLDSVLRIEMIPACVATVLRKSDFSLERVRQSDLLLFDCVAGSKAYGTNIEGSDEDRRGVFVAPRSFLFGLDHIEQTADERGDEVYYEIGRFVEMLLKNNPNALELLAMPEDCIRFRHPLYRLLDPSLFLSKLCSVTFGEYAMGQIRKARGLNKKIVNPEPEVRKGLLDFCHVPEGQGSTAVIEWLATRGMEPEKCGLTAVQHAAGVFAIYYDESSSYRGLVSPKDPDALVFSSVPFDASPVGWMHCNRDAFQKHFKAHREYWAWVSNRNQERYQNNSRHGRGYDSKNIMHTLRLLDMAKDIATEGELRVRRPNREFLLNVRSGDFAYEDLVRQAEENLAEVREAFVRSDLQEAPDREKISSVLIEIRETFGFPLS